MSCLDCKDQLYEVRVYTRDINNELNFKEVLIKEGIASGELHANLIVKNKSDIYRIFIGENDSCQAIITKLLKNNIKVHKTKQTWK